jgi:hypothetical protein
MILGMATDFARYPNPATLATKRHETSADGSIMRLPSRAMEVPHAVRGNQPRRSGSGTGCRPRRASTSFALCRASYRFGVTSSSLSPAAIAGRRISG